MTELAEATAALVAATGQLVTTKAQVIDWATGTATGGPQNDGRFPFTAADGTDVLVPSPALLAVTFDKDREVSTDLFWYMAEPALRIQAAIDKAFDEGKDVFIPRKEDPYVFNHPGLYFPLEDGEWRRTMMLLRNGVSIRSNGAVLKHADGRINPPSFFSQRYAQDERLDNIEIDGMLFDGGWRMIDPNIADLRQRYSFDNYVQKVNISSGTPWDVTQIGHVISIWRGDNIHVRRCRFQNVLGYGVALGTTTWAGIEDITYPRYHGVSNSHVEECQFHNLYHGGVFFPASWKCSVKKCVFDGDGYYVAAIDCERHHENDEVTNITIDDNDFIFSNGYGPIAEGHDSNGNVITFDKAYGRTYLFRFRLATSMGWFAGGNNDLSRGHKFINNRIYQGQLQVFGHREVTIDGNNFQADFEDLSESAIYPPYYNLIAEQLFIRVYSNNREDDLTGVTITNNIMNGDIQSWGMHLYRYDGIVESGNTIIGPRGGGVRRQHCSGTVTGGLIRNIGTEAAPKPIYQLEGGRGPTTIMGLIGDDTRVTVVPGANPGDPPSAIIPHYGTSCLIKMVGTMSQRIKVFGYSGFQAFTDKMFVTEAANENWIEQWGNGNGTFQTPNILLGDGSGSSTAHFLGSADGSLMLQFWSGTPAVPFEKPRLLIGSPGADPFGFTMLAFRAAGSGADQFFNYDSTTKEIRMIVGRITFDGSFQKPLGFLASGKKLWIDPQGSIRSRVVTADTPLANSFDGPALVEKVTVPTDPLSGVAPGHPGRSISWDADWLYVWTGNDLFRKVRLVNASTT